MILKNKKHQRSLLIILIAVSVGSILAGGIGYVQILQNRLQDQAIDNVLTVTKQQQQAFDNFISEDIGRLHSFKSYFADKGPEEIQEDLKLFNETDATYSVSCLDEGWICTNSFDDILQMDEDTRNTFLGLHDSGFGIRSNYIGPFSGTPRFCYYEGFTFADGHKGLIQKSYDRSKISETFSLSFYDNQGFAYVVDEDGNILMRSIDTINKNIFDLLTNAQSQQEELSQFKQALHTRATGSVMFHGKTKDYIYSYVPMKNINEWYLVSIVPLDAITAETDEILLDSKRAMWLLISGLAVCILFVLLIQRTHNAIEAEAKNAEYQTQLFHIFTSYLSSNTNDIYMMFDHDTHALEYVSPNVKQVLGINPEDTGGILHTFDADTDPDPESAKAYNKQLESMTPNGTVITRDIERVNAETGEHRYLQENAYCAVVQGHIKYMFYFSDRSKEHETQENLSEALQIANMANNAKSAFLSSVSHDIRSPMNSIIGFLTLMRDEVNNPEAVLEYNKRIDAASQHLLGLINDVLDMNKIESGSATLNIIDFSMAEIIEEISTIIHPQAKAKNQSFEILVTDLTYEHLLGDKLRINQILINLLSNAVKYTQEKGHIRLQIEELPQKTANYSHIRFTVSDDGFGMSEDYLKVIFKPFTREETKNTLHIQGTGLGMPITKSLVDLMGGKIQVESELGKGSTFTIELALHAQERKEDVGFWKDHNITKILVTDDEEDVCRYIVKTMSQIGVITDYATNGKDTIQMLEDAKEKGAPYSLILLDWKMPNLSGLETARLIRKIYPDDIPIILLTGYDWYEVEQEAVECGVNCFLSKPFFVTTFKKAIQRMSMDKEDNADEQMSSIVQGKHILIVDDMKANQFILSKILTTLGARCDIAGNGKEAVKMFEAALTDVYDLILMDVQMPVADGYTATRMIRSSNLPLAQTIPIIAMTANAFVEDVQDALDAGMDAHIAKPVQRDKLLATIQEIMEKK